MACETEGTQLALIGPAIPHGTQLVAHGTLSGEILKNQWGFSCYFLKFFPRLNFDLAIFAVFTFSPILSVNISI